MKVTKKVSMLVFVFAVFCLFTAQAWSTEVLYAPFEEYYYVPSSLPHPHTTVHIYPGLPGAPINLKPEACKFVNGIPAIPGKVGKAFKFDGKRYITVPTRPILNLGKKDFAITFWVKTTSEKTHNTIIDKRKTQKTPGYHVCLYHGRPLLHMCDAPNHWLNYCGVTSSPVVNDGKWHHVAIYVDRDNEAGGKIYIDGMCVHTFNPTTRSGSLNNDVDLFIGKHVDWANSYFDGTLDELVIFRWVN